MRRTILILFFFFSVYAFGQNFNPEITVSDIKNTIYFLASDSLKGRMPGTPEDAIAAGFIKNKFTSAGLQFYNNDPFQKFNILTGIGLSKNNSLKIGKFKGTIAKDYIPSGFSSNGNFSTDVVFAGYGMDINTDKITWNDYEGIDVKGKWALIFLGSPDKNQVESKYSQFTNKRKKITIAKDKGAAGVIFINGINYSAKDFLPSMFNDKNEAIESIPVLTVKRDLISKAFSKKNLNLNEIEEKLMTSLKPNSFDTKINASASVDVLRENGSTQNVVGYIEGTDPVLKDKYIIIGAHYDHLGMGGLAVNARDPDVIEPHNGADDNASGVAGVIELAEYFSKPENRVKCSLVFIAFSGEEMGLIGSNYFVKHPLIDLKNTLCMLNLDMIGRLDTSGTGLQLIASGSAAEFDSLISLNKTKHPLKVSPSPKAEGGSDHAPFYYDGIPAIFFFTGLHDDYHKATDDADKINFQGELKVLEFISGLVELIGNSGKELTYIKAKNIQGNDNQRSKMKVTLGIMPDFTANDVKGMLVGGVNKDGPADKAGILKGDIIISINGKKVENIYDYMARLGEVNPGDNAQVEITRNNEPILLVVQF